MNMFLDFFSLWISDVTNTLTNPPRRIYKPIKQTNYPAGFNKCPRKITNLPEIYKHPDNQDTACGRLMLDGFLLSTK